MYLLDHDGKELLARHGVPVLAGKLLTRTDDTDTLAAEGVTMGHAGALVHGNHGTYAAKRAALEAAGVTVFASLNEMVSGITRRFR